MMMDCINRAKDIEEQESFESLENVLGLYVHLLDSGYTFDVPDKERYEFVATKEHGSLFITASAENNKISIVTSTGIEVTGKASDIKFFYKGFELDGRKFHY